MGELKNILRKVTTQTDNAGSIYQNVIKNVKQKDLSDSKPKNLQPQPENFNFFEGFNNTLYNT